MCSPTGLQGFRWTPSFCGRGPSSAAAYLTWSQEGECRVSPPPWPRPRLKRAPAFRRMKIFRTLGRRRPGAIVRSRVYRTFFRKVKRNAPHEPIAPWTAAESTFTPSAQQQRLCRGASPGFRARRLLSHRRFQRKTRCLHIPASRCPNSIASRSITPSFWASPRNS